jgi:hypothetical protein
MHIHRNVRRITWAAFAFFLAKGLAWIVVAFLVTRPLQ